VIRKRKEEETMRSLSVWIVATTLSVFGTATFTLCLLWDLAFPAFSMTPIWKVVLPGFQGLTWGSYLLGLAEIIFYALYTAVIFVPTYNWLAHRVGGSESKEEMQHV
jgi:hypothetical protein